MTRPSSWQKNNWKKSPVCPRRIIQAALLQVLLTCRQCNYAIYRTSSRTSKCMLYYYRCLDRATLITAATDSSICINSRFGYKNGIERLLTAYQEELLSLAQPLQPMAALRKQQQTIDAKLQSLELAATHQSGYLRLTHTQTEFCHKAAQPR